jgi:hypothetical protein
MDQENTGAARVATGEDGLPAITLSDGRVARYTRKPKGKDSELAADAAGKKQNNVRLTAVLLSRIVVIDDRPVNAEQILDLDLDDLNLVAEKMPGNF